ncbi:MAG: PIN domain-containing protein [Gammaproteobacteria bacterium]|nr:MAG: PIN domain-containing protein [Gammaproteobacteria bacterium]
MGVLVDTSIWIDYFKGGNNSNELGALIDENLVEINDVILAELVPYLKVKKQVVVIKLLQEITRLPMQINWDEIVAFQVRCLKAGANGVGIPDLLIAQNAKANNCKIYTLDKHFHLLKQVIKVKLY